MTATNPDQEEALPREAIVAANVRRLREAAGMTQAEVSERATKAGYDLGEMAVWGLEKGRRRVRVEELFVLAEVLGTTAQHLLTPDTDPSAPGMLHEITFEGDTTECVTADAVEWEENWIRFFLLGQLVYVARAMRVLGVKVKRGAS